MRLWESFSRKTTQRLLVKNFAYEIEATEDESTKLQEKYDRIQQEL